MHPFWQWRAKLETGRTGSVASTGGQLCRVGDDAEVGQTRQIPGHAQPRAHEERERQPGEIAGAATREVEGLFVYGGNGAVAAA